jgi:hypothetical protein
LLPHPAPAAVALLEAGLAKLHPSFDPYSTPGGQELEAAQAKARSQKLKVWEKDEPEAAAAATEEEESAAAAASGGGGGSREKMEVVVSDVADANGIYVQVRTACLYCCWHRQWYCCACLLLLLLLLTVLPACLSMLACSFCTRAALPTCCGSALHPDCAAELSAVLLFLPLHQPRRLPMRPVSAGWRSSSPS